VQVRPEDQAEGLPGDLAEHDHAAA
jgi:hypothetical protein